ncbi:MAG: acyl-CoA thioesterase [Chloroherpetonaceae bacterium]
MSNEERNCETTKQFFTIHYSLFIAIDQVAYTCASRYSESCVVTLSVDQVLFKEPIHIGELVTFLASINYTGRTSMEVGIKVIAENVQLKSVRHTNTSYFTMVAVDEQGKPKPVPPFVPKTTTEKRRYEMAKFRRQMLNEYRQKQDEMRKTYPDYHE